MARISKTIIAFAILQLIAAVTGQGVEKRSPKGFLGMRGKKLYDVPEFYKRKPQFFVGVKGKKNMYDSFESPDLYFKRAPMGFMGMRGKKDLQYYDEVQAPIGFESILQSNKGLHLDESKRAPMGFVGMRGKKELYLDEENRVPMGFVGMPGLKEWFFDEEKRSPMGFMGMRGKKDLLLDEDKRGPMGFVGMRGKKDWLYDEEKRGPMGFVGMRGKKDSSYEVPNLPNLPDGFSNSPKRGSLIGQIDYDAIDDNNNELMLLHNILNNLKHPDSVETVTVKEPTESITNEIEKRAANMDDFFGYVRGKKNDKRPYDLSFRGKFIGVRGKKNVAQEIKVMLNQGSLPKRKGSMGFIGMRGKKWDDDSSPETVSSN